MDAINFHRPIQMGRQRRTIMKKLALTLIVILATWGIGNGIVTVCDFVVEQNQISDYVTSITEDIQDI